MMILITSSLLIGLFFGIGVLLASPTGLSSIRQRGLQQRTRFVYGFSLLAVLLAFLLVTGYGAVLSTLDSSCLILMDASGSLMTRVCESPSLWHTWLANLQPAFSAEYALWLGLAGFSGLGAWWNSVRNLRDVRKAHLVTG